MPADDGHKQFINRALSFTLLENLFKPLAPILELVCAGLFAGGDWGRYKFYESFMYLVFRISLMGMDKGIIWYYAQVEENVYLKTLFRSLSWCFFSFGFLSLITVASYKGYIPHSEWILGKATGNFHITNLGLMAYLMAVPMMLISELCIQANVNKRNLKYRILVPGITVPLITFGFAILGRSLAPELVSLPFCLLIGNGAGALVAIIGFLRVHRPSWKDISLLPIPPMKLIRYSFPLASANIFSALAARVDIFMLAGMAGLQSVEIYTVVSMIGRSLTSIRQSFENILLSTFSSMDSHDLTLKLKRYFNYSIWLVMAVQSIFMGFVIYFGTECLGLISPQYAMGYWVLLITSLMVYLNTVSDFAAILTLGLGRSTIVPLIQIVFLGVNFGLNFLLIPRWDATGAAWALGLANLVSGILFLGFLIYRHKTFPLIGEYWLSILAGTALFAIPGALAYQFHLDLVSKIVLFVTTLALGFWIQRTWYRRFNRSLH